jgi:hypothetical protein
MFDFGSIKKMLGNYAGELKKLRAGIEVLECEREDVLFAPPAQSDVHAVMVKWVESHRTAYQSKLQKELHAMTSSRFALEGENTIAAKVPMYRPASGEQFLGGLDRAMCGMFGDVLIKSIDATLGQIEWSKDCLGTTERARRLAALDEKLAALRVEEAKLVSAASDVGVDVSAIE